MAVVSVLFAYSLIPTVYQSIKQGVHFPFQTVVITSFGMIVTEIFYLHSKMYLAFSLGMVTTFCWLILLYLKIKNVRTKEAKDVSDD